MWHVQKWQRRARGARCTRQSLRSSTPSGNDARGECGQSTGARTEAGQPTWPRPVGAECAQLKIQSPSGYPGRRNDARAECAYRVKIRAQIDGAALVATRRARSARIGDKHLWKWMLRQQRARGVCDQRRRRRDVVGRVATTRARAECAVTTWPRVCRPRGGNDARSRSARHVAVAVGRKVDGGNATRARSARFGPCNDAHSECAARHAGPQRRQRKWQRRVRSARHEVRGSAASVLWQRRARGVRGAWHGPAERRAMWQRRAPARRARPATPGGLPVRRRMSLGRLPGGDLGGRSGAPRRRRRATAMQAHARRARPGRQHSRHAVVLMDRAGWRIARDLAVPADLTPLFVPPYSPELSAIERVWLYLCERFLPYRLWWTISSTAAAEPGTLSSTTPAASPPSAPSIGHRSVPDGAGITVQLGTGFATLALTIAGCDDEGRGKGRRGRRQATETPAGRSAMLPKRPVMPPRTRATWSRSRPSSHRVAGARLTLVPGCMRGPLQRSPVPLLSDRVR